MFRARRSAVLSWTAVLSSTLCVGVPGVPDARANDASPAAPVVAAAPSLEWDAVLARLEDYAERFEQMEKRGSFVLRGRMEELNGSGGVDAIKELVVRVTATPSERITEVLRYIEDGADKTSEAREKSGKKDAAKKKLKLPFLRSEKARYEFRVLERRAKAPHQMRVEFKPREPNETTLVGSAWVDGKTGEVLTMSFSPSKTPLFVDHIHVQVRFDNLTSLGRAPSRITFDARGGVLVFKKHYRGSATLTDAKIAF